MHCHRNLKDMWNKKRRRLLCHDWLSNQGFEKQQPYSTTKSHSELQL